MNVFLTGATGLIATSVARVLVAAGHDVTALSRRASARLPAGVRLVEGDPTRAGAWQEVLSRCDACVHLAGEPIASARWTEERKRSIRESRVESTKRVSEVIAGSGPTVLVSGSAVGFYGPRGDEELDEQAGAGSDFLADVCREWEAASAPASARARVVLLRTGMVLSRDGGALPRMLLPFRFFAGGPIGDGAFWQSWIHLADVASLVTWALSRDGVSGPLNATAPAPVRNRDLAAAIGRALHRPSVIPVPAAALRLVLGELASAVATGQRVVPRKALAHGFAFRFTRIDAAMQDLLGR